MAFVVLTRSLVQRLSAPPPRAEAKWGQPVIHTDDSPDIVDSFANIPKVTPIYIRFLLEEEASSSCFALGILRLHCGLLRLHSQLGRAMLSEHF